MAFSIRFDLPHTAARRAKDERGTDSAQQHRTARQGFGLGVAAYGLWGVLPIYFKALRSIDSVDIVAHRIVWSLPSLRSCCR